MGEALPISATDRLPWLDTVEAKTESGPQEQQAKQPPKSGRGRKLVWLLALALFCAGLFWVGRMSGQPKPVGLDQVGQVAEFDLPPAETTVVPRDQSAAKTAPKAHAVVPAAPSARPPAEAVVKPVAEAAPEPAAPKPAVKPAAPRKLAKASAAAKLRAKAPPKPAPPLAPPGQEIQVGAFSTEGHARQAMSSMVERYPLLEAMPRGIAPIVVKPSGRRLYRLRLGASSKEQAQLACQILRLDGRNCVVIG